ncbi:MAG: ABC transporter ATP-binding protein [Lachnospiraceae bacterium]
MKQWIKCLGQYKKDTILTPLFVLLEVIMEIIIPLVMAAIIDYGIDAGNMNVVVKYGLILVFMCLFSLVFGMASGRYAARASAGFAKNLRQRLFRSVQDFSFTNIDRFSSTSLVTRMTTDVTNVQNAFMMIIRMLCKAPLLVVFSIIMSMTISTRLSLIFLIMVPIMAIGLAIIIMKSTPVFQKVFRMYDKLNLIVQENLRGIRVVKSYVKEDYETQKFKKSSGDIHKYFVKAEKILAFNSPLMQFSMYICTLVICWLGAKMIVGGSLTTGQLMSFLTYSTQILVSLMMLSMVFVMVTMAYASGERILEVLDETSDIPSKSNAETEVKDGSIHFKDITFGYRGKDGKQCLQGIDLNIQAGQTVGIVGGTGSGKSSLVQLIPRLYDTTEGTVEVGGVDVRDYDIKALRSTVAMVLQKNVLFSGTVKDNLRWGKKDATDEEMEHVSKLAQAHEFVSTFPDGYDTWIEQGGSNVSGGQKQRLCIARALLKNPKILILDDSTSAVDTKTDALIRKSFKEEIPDTTKIIIAQRIMSVQDADLIIVMDEGQISATGTHDELMETSEIYKSIYESQQKGGNDNEAA